MRLIDADKLYPDSVSIKGDRLCISQSQIANAPTVCDIEQIRDKLISMSFRYLISRERGCIGIEEWTDRLIKNSDVLKVFEEYQKGGKE